MSAAVALTSSLKGAHCHLCRANEGKGKEEEDGEGMGILIRAACVG